MISSPEAYLRHTNIQKEDTITHRIHESIQESQNTGFLPDRRTTAWERALRLSVNKRLVAKATLQALRPAEYGERSIDKSLIDDRIAEGYISELKHYIDSNRVDQTAAFGIIEYFLRTRYRNLNTEQIEALFRIFPPRDNRNPFKNYKTATEATSQAVQIPGMDFQQSWETKREVMDLMELANLINQHYLRGAFGKTINISDLMKASALALRLVHQASSALGVALIKQSDRLMTRSTDETLTYRNLKTEALVTLMKRPGFALSLFLGKKPRNFQEDSQQLFSLRERVGVEGVEYIPQTGPVIIAFSHIERWKDTSLPIGWEKAAMIQQIKQRRLNNGISLIAYLNYYRETAHGLLKGVVDKAARRIASQLNKLYGVEVIDVNGFKLDNLKGFIGQSQAALRKNQALLISPEGLPAPEAIKPKRGLGMLARISGAPVVGVAFREEHLPNGGFGHKVVFTPPCIYHSEPGNSNQVQDQKFSDMIMRDIASQLLPEQRGIYL